MTDASSGTTANVLVIEDHDALRRTIVDALRKSGFTADGVFCAEALAEVMNIDRPDIYIIDVGLPGEDGMSLAARIRARQPEAGIILLTAQAALNTRLQGYGSGADVYLVKPVDPEELLALLRSMARRIVGTRADGSSDLLLDGRANILAGPKTEIPVTEAEKRVLTRFALAPHTSLERWELMEALGSADEPVSPRSLEVRIATLRKKISEALGDKSNPIVNIRGTGYRLTARISLR